jgi:hypothetical protein
VFDKYALLLHEAAYYELTRLHQSSTLFPGVPPLALCLTPGQQCLIGLGLAVLGDDEECTLGLKATSAGWECRSSEQLTAVAGRKANPDGRDT